MNIEALAAEVYAYIHEEWNVGSLVQPSEIVDLLREEGASKDELELTKLTHFILSNLLEEGSIIGVRDSDEHVAFRIPEVVGVDEDGPIMETMADEEDEDGDEDEDWIDDVEDSE